MRPTPIIFDYLIPVNRKARARRTDAQTSHDAAELVELGLADQRRRDIYSALELEGPMTFKEIAGCTGIEQHEVSRRLSEIEGIMPTGQTRQGSRVWALCSVIDAIAL
jgi:DNA-binding transcriptional ArsR family regulator